MRVRQINALPPGRRVYLGDGLGFSKNDKGKCKWFFRYTSPLTRKPNETTIGPYPAISHDDARAEVARMRGLLAKGIDPVAHKREQRASTTTFEEAAEGWKNFNKKKWRSLKQVNVLLRHFKPIAAKPVGQITSPMIVNCLKDLWEHHPEQARRALTISARVFDYAKAMEMRSGDNPASWKEKFKNIFTDRDKINEKHYPSLSFNSIPKFMKQLRLRHPHAEAAIALEFQILTASRPGETRKAQWKEFDLVNRIWVMPAHKTKQKRIHRVPLSERCMEILALQQETNSALNPDGYIFQGYNRTAMDDKATRGQLKAMGIPVTAHGFRSSFRNWAASNRISLDPTQPGLMERIPRELAELSLGHIVKDPTEGAYWTEDGLEERRPIMQAWADYCESAISSGQ